MAKDWVEVAREGELEGDGPWAVSARGGDLVLVRAGGELRAFDGVCPHQGALLGEGELREGRLVCRNHGWRFSAESGRREGGPECLAAFPVRVRDGRVSVDVGARRVEVGAAGGRRWHELPGPVGVPGFGSALWLRRAELHEQLERWAATWGPYCGFKVGGTPVFLVSDAALATEALRARPRDFRRLGKIDAVFRELGIHSVFTAEGDAWRRQRRLVMGALSRPRLAGFFPVFREVAGRLLAQWQGKAARGEVVEVQEDVLRFTADVISSLAFGRDVNTLAGGEDGLQEQIGVVLQGLSRRVGAVVPYWRVVSLPRDRALRRALEALRAWMSGVVDEVRRGVAAEPGRAPRNFLEAMLAATDDEGQPFEESVVLGNALTLLFAGEGLTGNTLAWAIHELCDAPEAVARLQEEVDRELGEQPFAQEIAGLEGLRYADAVTREAMRLRPVAPFVALEAIQNTGLGGLDVRAGEVLLCLLRGPGTREEVTAQPERFWPERWLEGEPEALARLEAAHLPFGSGPRICPGQALAFLETRTVLSLLYRNFEVERVGAAEDVRGRFRFAAVEPFGLRVRLRARVPAGT